jgi:hypothetical protein
MNATATLPTRTELNATLEQLFGHAKQLQPQAKERVTFAIKAALMKAEILQQNAQVKR